MHLRKKDNLPSIVDALKFRQEQYGYNQHEMALALGMTDGNYSDVLSGKRRLSINATRAAYAIGVPASVLLQ